MMKKLFITIVAMAMAISMASCSVNSLKRLPEVTVATANVTFVNEDPGATLLGLVRFILNENGDAVDYELMNMKWSDKKRIIELPPGLYGVTKYMPQPNASVLSKIKGFKKFEVKDKDILIHFSSMDKNNHLVL